MIHWWRNRSQVRDEVDAARRAEAEAEQRVDRARETLHAADTRAAKARRLNARNHFSETLTQAFGG